MKPHRVQPGQQIRAADLRCQIFVPSLLLSHLVQFQFFNTCSPPP